MKSHLGSHSFFWWSNQSPPGESLFPDAPPLTFAAMGYGGKFMMIGMPEYDLLIVWFDAFSGQTLSPFDQIGRFLVNEAIRELLAAKRSRDISKHINSPQPSSTTASA